MNDPGSYDELVTQLREASGLTPEEWEEAQALAEMERKILSHVESNYLARLEAARRTMPDLLRAEGYDIPEGFEFQWQR